MNVSSKNIYVPNDIINNILSFGDPEITIKYKSCINQLLYNKKEFDFLRNQKHNTYYNWKDYNFKTFILIRTNQKKKLNYNNMIKPLIISKPYPNLSDLYYD